MIYDDCEAATATLPTIKDVSWTKGAKKLVTEFTKFTVDPVGCKDRMKYVLTIPTAASEYVKADSTGLKMTIDGDKVVPKQKGIWATHSVVLKIQGPAGSDIASGSVTFKVTLIDPAVATAKTDATKKTVTTNTKK